MKKIVVSVALLTAVVFSFTSANGGEEKPKFKAKCIVAGQPAKMDKNAEYNGGTVYFCCDNCKGKFEAEPKKFAAKANHQLVATSQAKLVKCPFTGNKLNTDTKIAVDGVNVCFCCEMCQGKAEAAKGAAQVELIFNDAAFKKGFEVKKK